jgi:hypothetical protein
MGADHRIVPAIKQALSNVAASARGIAFRAMSRPCRQSPTGYQVNRERASHRQATRAIQSAGPFRDASDGVAPVSLAAHGKR